MLCGVSQLDIKGIVIHKNVGESDITMETCFNYCDSDVAFFSSDEKRWIHRIHKLKEMKPDDIEIIREPEVNDGCIYVKLPTSYLKIGPKKKYSEEQRAAMGDRLKQVRHVPGSKS